MDHLPTLSRGHPEVYFYGDQDVKYSPGDFFTIPANEPWNYLNYEDLLEHGLRPDMTADEANTFLTQWLYLSLVAQVLNRDISSSDFCKQGQQGPCLSTKKLNQFLREWHEGRGTEAGSTCTPDITQYIRISNALENARRFVSKHCSYNRIDRDGLSKSLGEVNTIRPGHQLDHRLKTELTLAIAILGETLQRERPGLERESLGDVVSFYNEPANEDRCWGYSVYCRDQMTNSQWCKSDIHYVESTITEVSIIYTMSRLEPLQSQSTIKHENCTTRACVARPVELQTQSALHMNCPGQCLTYGKDEAALSNWIKEGKTPLVCWTDKGLVFDGFDLTKSTVKFGALTHSWEDGLLWNASDARGKCNRRMHHCQVVRVQETFDRIIRKCRDQHNLGDQVWCWVDILCLPRDALTRPQALNQMKIIYPKAQAILIWDRALIQERTIASKFEINMRLRLTNWSMRLWPLQETVLAKGDLWVQFSDDVVSSGEIDAARILAKSDPNNEYYHIWKAAHPFRHVVWMLRTEPDSYRVARAWIAVQFRVVSRAADETIVLANILGLDVTQLESITEGIDEVVAAKRMAKFLTMLDKEPELGIPSALIFVPGLKLPMKGIKEVEGLGWAPRTWLNRQSHIYPLIKPLRQAGSILTDGLLVEFPGMSIYCSGKPPNSEVIWIPVDQGMHKWVKVVVDYEGKADDWQDFWNRKVCTNSELSIIMCTDRPRERWEVGILAQTKGHLRKGEIKLVKTICRAWFRREVNTNIIREKTEAFRLGKGPIVFGVRRKNQKWCVNSEQD